MRGDGLVCENLRVRFLFPDGINATERKGYVHARVLLLYISERT